MKTSILVVDDNPVNRKLATTLLVWEGYDVSQAADAESALVMLRSSPPALILLDLQLPKMDGLELARLLKSDPALNRIRIVAFTAHAMKGDEARAAAAGCDGYITKPIDTRKFGAQISDVLLGRSALSS